MVHISVVRKLQAGVKALVLFWAVVALTVWPQILAGAQTPHEGNATVPIAPCVILKTHPHDSRAFTQGLLYHGGFLYESLGRKGESALRKVALQSGRVLEERPLDGRYFGEGLALVGDKLLQLTWKAGLGLVYRLQGLEPAGGFSYQGEGWGLAMGPKYLYMTQGKDEVLALDPNTYAVVKRVAVTISGKPLPWLNELEWVEGRLWANVWQTPYIAIIHPDTGEVERLVDLTPCRLALPPEQPGEARDVANGVAYDAENKRLFVTGKRWPLLFQIATPE